MLANGNPLKRCIGFVQFLNFYLVQFNAILMYAVELRNTVQENRSIKATEKAAEILATMYSIDFCLVGLNIYFLST